MFYLNLEPYRDTHHSYVDALFTMKLGLGYITGVIVFILGAIFYIMCLPFVRKSGYFQVTKKKKFCNLKKTKICLVILLVSYVNTSLVDNNAFTWTKFLEMVSCTR